MRTVVQRLKQKQTVTKYRFGCLLRCQLTPNASFSATFPSGGGIPEGQTLLVGPLCTANSHGSLTVGTQVRPEQHGSTSYLFRRKAINNPGIGHTHATLHRGDLLPKFRADRMDQVGSKITGNNLRDYIRLWERE